MKFSLALILAFVVSSKAFACRDSSKETQTFFIELSQFLNNKDVVAKVRILSTETSNNGDRITTAKIISANKGIKVGTTIKVLSDMSSCNRDPEIRARQEYYVAGKIGSDGLFRGTWTFRERVGQK